MPAVEAVPREIIEAHRLRRGREGLVVRTFAWTGLTIGVVVALLPLILAGVKWWTFLLFFVLMFGFYVASANLANWIGDALGYRWGQSLFSKRWQKHVATRDAR
jgi:cell division protein FtsX